MAPSVAEMVSGDAALRSFAQGFDYLLQDLGALPLDGLSRNDELWSGLAALRYAFRGRSGAAVLERILRGLRDGSTFERQALGYIVQVWDVAYRDLETAARAAKPERWEAVMGELAQELIGRGRAEGRAAGIAEGMAEGRVAGLVRLLERRFGPLQARVLDRIEGAPLDRIEAWFDAAIDAPSLSDVFDDRSRH